MAVNPIQSITGPTAPAASRRMRVGANVAATVLLAVAVVGVLQAIAYNAPSVKVDMTSTGVNSLSEGTINLLKSLDQSVTLTSLYFQTDLEEEDQPLYRRTVRDLLNLYASTARSRVQANVINPLSDHEKLKDLQTRLYGKERFRKELEPYARAIERFRSELDPRARSMLQEELDALGGMTGPMADAKTASAVGQIETLFQRWSQELEAARNQVEGLMSGVSPQHTAAVRVIETVYRELGKALKDVSQFGRSQTARHPDLPQAAQDYLNQAGSRYADLVSQMEGEVTAIQSLEPPSIDNLVRELQPNANAIIVETNDDALVVDFQSVWPPLDPNRMGAVRFKDRGFKGEEKITSAILRVTHKEQTAVVFVRYGGAPLFFMGGFMPGQPPAPHAQMKRQLEDANFIVTEWDLKTDQTLPTIEPTPTRTIFVVLKPNEPQRDPMGRPSPEPPFSDAQRQALLDAMGEDARAVFVAGWFPGPFGPIPGSYEYADYLKEHWGITLDARLLIETISVKPGQYGVARRDFYTMDNVEITDHPIVSGPQSRVVALPWCAPIELANPLPEGVRISPLLIQPKRDGVWAVKNIQEYQTQMENEGYLHRLEADTEGPFTLAVAAERGRAKIVVVSGRDFAHDAVAFARGFTLTPQGLALRSFNPGNVVLLVNALHWLNDNTEFMNVGQPIDAAVLEIKSASTVKAVQVLTIFVWPALVLGLGGAVWWIRRR